MKIEELPQSSVVSIVEANDLYVTVKFNVSRKMIQHRDFSRSLNVLKKKLNYPWMNVSQNARFGNTKLNVSALKTFIESVESIPVEAK